MVAESPVNCTVGCATLGLECDADEFFARLGDIDSEAEFESVIQVAESNPSFACGDGSSAQNNQNTPTVRTGNNKCRYASVSLGLINVQRACSQNTQAAWRRICYCSSDNNRRLRRLEASVGSSFLWKRIRERRIRA